jgi:hypothetical protein
MLTYTTVVNVSVVGKAGNFQYQYVTIYVRSGDVVATVKGELVCL